MHTIGIDFGTTKTLVSRVNPRTGLPESLKLGRETFHLPSTVYIDDKGQYYFGDDADDMIEEETGCYMRGFKMKLGSATSVYWMSNRSILARDLVREYLKYIRRQVEKLVFHGERITKATITRPVKFSPAQCQELEQAAKDAGFQKIEFITEPEAAGLAYCRMSASQAFARSALVVDWGGGTLDFALVTRKDDTVQTHPDLTDGDTSMGGEKFDNLLWNHVEQAAEKMGVDQLDYIAQLPHVRRAKEVLSTQQNFNLRLSSAAGACPPIPLSRNEFNKLIEHDVAIAAEKIQTLIRRIPVEQKPEMLLLVGGSSLIPLIKEHLEVTCNLPAIRWQYSREAVALGAALYKQPLSITCSICQTKVLISNGHGECAKCQMEYTTNAAGNAQVAGLQIRCSICQNILTTTCHEATCSHCGSTIRWNSGTGRWNLIKQPLSITCSICQNKVLISNGHGECSKCQMEYTTNAAGNAQVAGLQIRCSICQNILTTTCHEATCSHCGSRFRWNSGTGRWNLINERKKQQSNAISHKKVSDNNQTSKLANQKKNEDKSGEWGEAGCIMVAFIGGCILLGSMGLLEPLLIGGSWIAIIWGIFYLITKKK